MGAIKITANTTIKGQPVKTGETFNIPDGVSEKDARTLLVLGKAERIEKKPAGGGDGGKSLNAKDTIAAVKTVETLEDLDDTADGEDRSSVVAAIEARRAELEEAA